MKIQLQLKGVLLQDWKIFLQSACQLWHFRFFSKPEAWYKRAFSHPSFKRLCESRHCL